MFVGWCLSLSIAAQPDEPETMGFLAKFLKIYFNVAYNQVYDLTTARLNHYRLLQEKCIGKLQFNDHDKVLCVGLGTGNELALIARANGNVNITGIDYSNTALKKARQKALRIGGDIRVLNMDATSLEFPADTFDKVVCIHVTDFVTEDGTVAGEILRVLKRPGQFVITFPSDKESLRLGTNLFKKQLRSDVDAESHRVRNLLNLLLQVIAGVVYLPLFFRSKRKSYSRGELEAVIARLNPLDFQIDEYPLYQDFIVYGEK